MTAKRAARFISLGDFADELAVSRWTISRAIKRGDLDAFVDGQTVRIQRVDADAYIAARMTSAPRRRVRGVA